MQASGDLALQVVLAVAAVAAAAYVAGRVHQWYRHGLQREVAYRRGYDQASSTLFALAIRTLRAASPHATNDRGGSATRLDDRTGVR
ncbi:hypothetical protein EV385_1934 [Krasilnikovia cinnamomea]|uniref:Uncharacterized protein n=1 Tax=Krasilnikovia cinnamomea TaxID=349313 RepID=A0A4Q7ZJ58_9ACTN|nr:hypothetical protein [Krasilnikovia cinnamomea]RZU50169.1 hypothetical protein EV385_1934 [Krasilnikovia cinnamomea]